MEVITGLPYALLRRRPPTGSSCPGSRVIALYNILRNCGAILIRIKQYLVIVFCEHQLWYFTCYTEKSSISHFLSSNHIRTHDMCACPSSHHCTILETVCHAKSRYCSHYCWDNYRFNRSRHSNRCVGWSAWTTNIGSSICTKKLSNRK